MLEVLFAAQSGAIDMIVGERVAHALVIGLTDAGELLRPGRTSMNDELIKAVKSPDLAPVKSLFARGPNINSDGSPFVQNTIIESKDHVEAHIPAPDFSPRYYIPLTHSIFRLIDNPLYLTATILGSIIRP